MKMVFPYQRLLLSTLALASVLMIGCSGVDKVIRQIREPHASPQPEIRAVDELLSDLRAKSPLARVRAAEGLAAMASRNELDAAIAGALLLSLHDKNHFVREAIVSAIGDLAPKQPKFRRALQERLRRDPSSTVRAAARAALTKLGDGSIREAADSAETEELKRSPFGPRGAPAGWRAVRPFPSGSLERTCAAGSSRRWQVSAREGELRIDREIDVPAPLLPLGLSAKERPLGKPAAIEVEDGWLLSFTSKRHGGAVWWFSNDGKQKSVVSKRLASGFANSPAGVLAFHDVEPPATQQGQLLLLSKGDNGRWAAAVAASSEFPIRMGVPEPSGMILLLTSESIERWDPSGSIRTIHSGAWGDLEPASLALASDGVIYVGMRHAVSRIIPVEGGYAEEWLVPKDCYPNVNDGACRCSSKPPAEPASPPSAEEEGLMPF